MVRREGKGGPLVDMMVLGDEVRDGGGGGGVLLFLNGRLHWKFF